MRRTLPLALLATALAGSLHLAPGDEPVAAPATAVDNHAVAPAVDPDVVGPARRAAAGTAKALGAPGVERRIERREERRDAVRSGTNPNAAARNADRAVNNDHWRYRWHNSQWWYYTPQNRWMIYNNNAWSAYDPNTYAVPRYQTGYRGYDNGGRPASGYYYRRGARPQTFGPATTPYSNGTPAGNFGSNLGADIGAAANGGAGANQGAAIGGAIGNAIGAGNATAPAAQPAPAQSQPAPAAAAPHPAPTNPAPGGNP